MSDVPDLERCWHYDCGTLHAPHEVAWKCAAGHRSALRYCTAHIGPAMKRALAAAPGEFCCARCDGDQEIRPVLEGAASPAPVLPLPASRGTSPARARMRA